MDDVVSVFLDVVDVVLDVVVVKRDVEEPTGHTETSQTLNRVVLIEDESSSEVQVLTRGHM